MADKNTMTADDVRETLATEWLISYHGSIDATALTLAFKAGYAAAKVRPRGTVTDAEVQAALNKWQTTMYRTLSERMRFALEAAREVNNA